MIHYFLFTWYCNYSSTLCSHTAVPINVPLSKAFSLFRPQWSSSLATSRGLNRGWNIFHWSKTDAWKTYPNLTCINESERDLGTVKNSTKLNTKIHTSLSSKIVTITVLKMTIFLIWHLYGLCVVKFWHKNHMIRVRKISLFGFKYLLCCGQGTFVFMVKRNNWLLETGKKQDSPLSKSNTLSRVTRGLCQLSINIRWF